MPNGEHTFAPYAVRSADSRGREYPEPDDPLRGPFEFDRHRIIESMAFRRLEHKTQVQDPEKLIERFKSRRTEDSTEENPRYEEKFRVVKYG